LFAALRAFAFEKPSSWAFRPVLAKNEFLSWTRIFISGYALARCVLPPPEKKRLFPLREVYKMTL
jgi:hypothetical protein